MSFRFDGVNIRRKIGLGNCFNKILTFGTVLLGFREVGVVKEVLKKGWKLC